MDNILFALECADREFEISMMESNFLLDVVNFQYNHNKDMMVLESTISEMSEEDTLLRCEELYLEAENEKKNIFQKMWEAILKAFRSIKDAILKLFKKEEPEGTVEVPKNIWDTAEEATKKSNSIGKKVFKSIAIAGAVVASGVAAKKIHDKVKQKRFINGLEDDDDDFVVIDDEELKKATEDLSKSNKKLKDAIDNPSRQTVKKTSKEIRRVLLSIKDTADEAIKKTRCQIKDQGLFKALREIITTDNKVYTSLYKLDQQIQKVEKETDKLNQRREEAITTHNGTAGGYAGNASRYMIGKAYAGEINRKSEAAVRLKSVYDNVANKTKKRK